MSPSMALSVGGMGATDGALFATTIFDRLWTSAGGSAITDEDRASIRSILRGRIDGAAAKALANTKEPEPGYKDLFLAMYRQHFEDTFLTTLDNLWTQRLTGGS